MVGKNVMPSRHSDIFYSLSFNLLSFIVMLDSNKNALAHTFAAFRELIFIFFGCFFFVASACLWVPSVLFLLQSLAFISNRFRFVCLRVHAFVLHKVKHWIHHNLDDSLTAIWQSTHASDEEYNCQWTPRNLNHASCEYYLCRCL